MKLKFFWMIALLIFLFSISACDHTNTTPPVEPQREPSTMLSLTIKMHKTEYNVGEPIYIEITLTNKGTEGLTVNKRMLVNHPASPVDLCDVKIFVMDSSGYRLPFWSRISTYGPEEEDFIVISPGKSITTDQEIQVFFDLTKPGSYSVIAFYQNYSDPKSGSAWKGEIESNQLFFEIPPTQTIPTKP